MSEESPTLAPTPIMDAAWRKCGPLVDSHSMQHMIRVGADLERRLADVTAERDQLRTILRAVKFCVDSTIVR